VDPDRVVLRRLWWAGPLAIVTSAAANEIVRRLAVAVLAPSPQFVPLTPPAVLFWTVVGIAGATVVFAVVVRYAVRPVRTFVRIALVALVLSWVPDLWLLAARLPGTTVAGVGVLMFMHVVAAAIGGGLLIRLTRAGPRTGLV
jgi:uncharacterized membrane protein